MKAIPFLVLLSILAAGLFWFLHIPDRSVSSATPTHGDDGAVVGTQTQLPADGSEPEAAPDPIPAPVRSGIEPAAANAEPKSDETPRARVFGTVVDVDGAPLAGVEASLTRTKPWAEGSDEAQDSPRDASRAGFFTTTDDRGAFGLDVRLPSSGFAIFELRPDALRERIEVYLMESNAQ